jgi:hypothetical protein
MVSLNAIRYECFASWHKFSRCLSASPTNTNTAGVLYQVGFMELCNDNESLPGIIPKQFKHHFNNKVH